MTFEPLPPAICSALRELARLANQTDVQITIGHDGRIQLYDLGGELFENVENYAQSISPDEAAAGLAQALHERSSGWEGWPNATSAGSGRSVDVARYAAWRCEHYSSALHFGAEAPPGEWVCADCGDTSDDAGRYRKAEDYEAQYEDGECYECSTCGCQMAMPPPPHNATSAGAIGENPTE